MASTIYLQSSLFESTATAMTIKLKSAGVVINTGGDTLTEATGGYFSATVAEDLATEYYDVDLLSDGVLVAESFLLKSCGVVGEGPSLNHLYSKYSAGASLSSPVPVPTRISLINGDTYDGVANPLLSWTVAKDYAGADDVKLVFYDAENPSTVFVTYTGVVASATQITVDIDMNWGASLVFEGCHSTARSGFALVASWPTDDDETIAFGDAYIYDRGVPA